MREQIKAIRKNNLITLKPEKRKKLRALLNIALLGMTFGMMGMLTPGTKKSDDNEKEEADPEAEEFDKRREELTKKEETKPEPVESESVIPAADTPVRDWWNETMDPGRGNGR